MTVFDYQDYKQFVRDFVASQSKKGRGQYRQMAESVGMHTTLVSQIFKGDRELTPEQATGVSEFLGLTELETEMFLNLVDHSRAGNLQLRKIIEQRIQRIREQAQKLDQRLPQDKALSEDIKSIFYGHWYYSAIRLATDIEEVNSVEQLAAHLNLPRALVAKVLDFLLANGLVKRTDEKLMLGPQRTHLGSESPYVPRHHINWRLKSLNKAEHLKPEELMFTAPFVASEGDIAKIRKTLLQAIDEVYEIVGESPSEKLAYLNIDLAEI